MELLKKESYGLLAGFIEPVTINCLFARAVIDRRVNGRIYVDNQDDPRTFYVVHPYGMSLLFGDWTNEEFNVAFKDYSLNKNPARETHEWMQAFPGEWDTVLSGLYQDCMVKSSDNTGNGKKGFIELNTRINFTFIREKYLDRKRVKNSTGYLITRTDREIFGLMKGSVVPSKFWDSADDFEANGIGFSLFCENRLASTAYSAFIHGNKLEIGIETFEEFRGRGLAEHTCSALIDYCLDNDLEPVWACRLENTGSCNLAIRLGFVPVAEIPYYRLSI